MKNKKIFLLLLSVLVIGTTATSNAVYISDNENVEVSDDIECPEVRQEELKHTRINEAGQTIEVYEKEIKEDDDEKAKYIIKNKETGRFINIYTGTIYSEEDRKINDEERIKYILRDKETGRFINIYTGTIDPKEENKDTRMEVITPRATSKPTTIKWENYTGDWSGTINFTYTKYAFPSGHFVAWADQPFSLIVYDFEYDTSTERVYADYKNGRYEVEGGGGNYTYYYKLSNKNKGEPVTNAIYKSVPHYWHNN
ncbi:hypothetical protein ACTNDY_13295 [Tissierellaceae bacterium HCP3S3_D8]|jgi:hypothetical protein